MIALFCLATGVALVLAGAVLSELQPVSFDDFATVANGAAVREFYAAQNVALTTGDGPRLFAALDPNFVDHRPGAGAAQDRSDLVEALSAVHDARPGTHLAAEPVLVAGDRVLVSVQVIPGSPINLASVTPSTLAVITETVEVVRVAGGMVVERWSLAGGSGPEWPSLTPAPHPIWPSSQFATATAQGLVCLASGCH